MIWKCGNMLILLLTAISFASAEFEEFDFGAAPGRSPVLRRTDTHAVAKRFFRRQDVCDDDWSEQCIEWHEECTEEGTRTCKQTAQQCTGGWSKFCSSAGCATTEAICERSSRKCTGGFKKTCTRTSKQCTKFLPGMFDWLCDAWEYVCEETDWVCDAWEMTCDAYVDACNVWDNACTAPRSLCNAWDAVCTTSTKVTCNTWKTTCKATGEVCSVLTDIGTVLVDAVENFGQCLDTAFQDIKSSVKGECIAPPENINCYVKAGGATVLDGFVAGCPIPTLSFDVQFGSSDPDGDKTTAIFAIDIGSVDLDVPMFEDAWLSSGLMDYLAVEAHTDFTFTNDAKLTVSDADFTLTLPGLQWGFDSTLTLMADTQQTPCSNEDDCTIVLNKGRTTLLEKAFAAGPVPVLIMITAEVYLKAIPTLEGSARTDISLYFSDDVTLLDTAHVTLADPMNAVDEIKDMFDASDLLDEIKSKIRFEVSGELEAKASLQFCIGVKLGFHVNGVGTTLDFPVCMTAELTLDASASVSTSSGGASIDVNARVYLNKLEIPVVLDLPDIDAAIDTACGFIKGPFSGLNDLNDLIWDCTTVFDCVEDLVDDICDGVGDAVDVLSLQANVATITVFGEEIDIWSTELVSMQTTTTSVAASTTSTGYSYTVAQRWCVDDYGITMFDHYDWSSATLDNCMSQCDAIDACTMFIYGGSNGVSCQMSYSCTLDSDNLVDLTDSSYTGYFTVMNTYALGVEGTNECPEGYDFIETVFECKKAAEWDAREEWDEHHVGHDFGTSRPRGCYLDETWGTTDTWGAYIKGIYFNDDAVGGAVAGATPICKKHAAPRGYTESTKYCSSEYKNDYGAYGYEDTPDIASCAAQCNAEDLCISFLWLDGEEFPCRLSYTCTLESASSEHAGRSAFYKTEVSAPSSCGIVQGQAIYVGCYKVYVSERDRDEQCNCGTNDDCHDTIVWLDDYNGNSGVTIDERDSCGLKRGQTVAVNDCGVWFQDEGWTTWNTVQACVTADGASIALDGTYDSMAIIFDSWTAPIEAWVPNVETHTGAISDTTVRTFSESVTECDANDACGSIECSTYWDECTLGDGLTYALSGTIDTHTTYVRSDALPPSYYALEETLTSFPKNIDTADVLGLHDAFTVAAWVRRTTPASERRRCKTQDNKIPTWSTGYSSSDYPSYDTVEECRSLCLTLDNCVAMAWRREDDTDEWSRKCLTWTFDELDADGMSSSSSWASDTNFSSAYCFDTTEDEYDTPEIEVTDGSATYMSCSTGERISQITGYTEDECRTHCENDADCYILYFQSADERPSHTTSLCHIYQSCETLRVAAAGGTHRIKKLAGDISILGTDATSSLNGLHLIVRHGRYYMGFYYGDCSTTAFNTLNAWEHVVFSYDSSGTQTIYVNGVKVQECTNQSAFQGTGMVRIGQSFGGNRWQGSIKDIRIWKQALSDIEIEALYHYNSQASKHTIVQPSSWSWCSADDMTSQWSSDYTEQYTLDDAKDVCSITSDCKAVTCHAAGHGNCADETTDTPRCCQMRVGDTLYATSSSIPYTVTTHYPC